MTTTRAGASMPGGSSTVGVLRVGPAQVAVTLGVLREVLPCPEELEPLPAAGTGLLGVLNVRGAVVPVLDLRLLLGWPAERGADQVVTVVSLDDRVLGLLCDEVLGVSGLADSALQRLDDRDGDLLFSHSFERPEDGRVVSLLDIEQLLSLPGVPAARTRTGSDDITDDAVDDVRAGTAVDGARDHPNSVTPGEPAAEIVVVTCGEVRFGLDVASVHALLPKVDLIPSPLVGALCSGVTAYGDRSIAAVHLLRLVGLAGDEDPGVNGGLILRFAGTDGPGFVALLLSEVIEIVRVPDARLLRLPTVLASVAGWFRGVVALPGVGDVLVLDPARLAGDPELTALAALNTAATVGSSALPPGLPGQRSTGESPEQPGAERESAVDGSAPVGIRYLTYIAGDEVATPLLQVSEIITYPEAWTPILRPESALLGVFTHRGTVVPLVCLPSLLAGRSPDDATDPDRRVIIVSVPTGTIGFIVPTLRAIEVSTWEESPDPADPADHPGWLTPAAAAAVSHVVRVGAEGLDRNLRTLDLAAVATALTATQGEVAGPVPPGEQVEPGVEHPTRSQLFRDPDGNLINVFTPVPPEAVEKFAR